LSREKDMQMSKERYREQEARKPVSEMVQQLRVKINGVDNVDTFIKEQKGKKEHKGGSGIDTQSDKEGGKKKTYCLYVCSQIYHGDEVPPPTFLTFSARIPHADVSSSFFFS
jgi:hypothetical protein